MSLRENLNDWSDKYNVAEWVAASIFTLVVAFALWDHYSHEIKSVAIVVLILVAEFLDKTLWYFWVILLGALFWMRANRKNRQRQEIVIGLLAEIRDKLNSR